MKEKNKSVMTIVSRMIISIYAAAIIAQTHALSQAWWLIRRGMLFRYLPTLLFREPLTIILPVAFVICCLTFIVSLFKLIGLGTGGHRDSTMERDVQKQRIQADRKRKQKMEAQGLSGSSEVIHVQTTGRQKYLDQLEEYRRNGLVDREEYEQLKKQYEQMDIPDRF